jgi:hypothetical protein
MHYAPPAQSPGPNAPPLYRQNFFVPPGASTAPLFGPGLRKWKLALGIAQVATMVAGLGLLIGGAVVGPDRDAGAVLMGVGGGFLLLWELLLIAYAVVGLVWTYKFWSWIPPEQRHTSLWKKYISPGQALGFMFIPYFNIFWMFVIYLGIADALERMRVAYPTDKPPAKNIALVRLIVPLVFFPAGPFVDYFFDKHVEGMAADMQARMLAQAAAAQPN